MYRVYKVYTALLPSLLACLASAAPWGNIELLELMEVNRVSIIQRHLSIPRKIGQSVCAISTQPFFRPGTLEIGGDTPWKQGAHIMYKDDRVYIYIQSTPLPSYCVWVVSSIAWGEGWVSL